MNKIERVWGINSQNRRGKYRKKGSPFCPKLGLNFTTFGSPCDCGTVYYCLCFSGITLPNFLLDEEEKERNDLTKKQKLYTQGMR